MTFPNRLRVEFHVLVVLVKNIRHCQSFGHDLLTYSSLSISLWNKWTDTWENISISISISILVGGYTWRLKTSRHQMYPNLNVARMNSSTVVSSNKEMKKNVKAGKNKCKWIVSPGQQSWTHLIRFKHFQFNIDQEIGRSKWHFIQVPPRSFVSLVQTRGCQGSFEVCRPHWAWQRHKKTLCKLVT